MKIKKKQRYLISFELLHGIETCNQDISKTITASSFKLGQLIEDNK